MDGFLAVNVNHGVLQILDLLVHNERIIGQVNDMGAMHSLVSDRPRRGYTGIRLREQGLH